MSGGMLTQNRDVVYRMIVYNCYQITGNLLLIVGGLYKTISFLAFF